ncbi:nuclear transport factor 2 family protein [Aureibaculum luteum]|uniref:nuclear transport factor 2 family protein n=1 Tax=Aureibaculum luteum TaxID=1548456 RepID=UPI001E549D50|nr:nuclear transport factor 2 family protein [Aureibaculum luteum]
MFSKRSFLYFFGFFLMFHFAFAQSNDEVEIKEVIDVFFAGLHAGDTLKIREAVGDKIIMQSVNDSGLKSVIFNDFLKNIASINPETTKIKEKIISLNIKSDGVMANAWTPYDFYINSEFSHCGINSFQLVKIEGSWKIIYIIDTRRKDNCN